MNQTEPRDRYTRREALQAGLGFAAVVAGSSQRVEAAGGGWTQFRGTPRQLGIAAGTLKPALKVAWKFKTGGPVMSSAVMDGAGRVFVGSDDKNLYALKAADGTKLWSFAATGAVQAPPTLVNGLVVVGSEDGNLYAVDARTGALRWKYATDDKILGAANWASAPNGKGIWIVAGSYDNFLHCVDTRGKRVWVYETGNYVNGTPAIEKDRVVFGNCDGNLYALSLKTGQPTTTINVRDYIPSSIAVDQGKAYFGHYGNQVVAANLLTGKIDWTFRDRNFAYFSSPAVTKDRVVIGGRDKRIHCLDRATGKAIWEARTRGQVDSSPVICDGKVVVGSEDGRIYLLSLADGSELWNYEVGAPVMSSAAVVNGRVLMGAKDGYLYAFTGA